MKKETTLFILLIILVSIISAVFVYDGRWILESLDSWKQEDAQQLDAKKIAPTTIPKSSTVTDSQQKDISDTEDDSAVEDKIVIERKPTIVDGTKKVVTKRDRFILAAAIQHGVTTQYDGAYQKISYPNGDVDISTGVCTDVVIRAFRALNIDLQREIHRDMRRNFGRYPRKWGLTSPDPNIDHRRVANMETYFTRKGYKLQLKKTNDYSQYQPGDLVVWRIKDQITHIGIVSDQLVEGTSRHYIIHNPYQGVEISDWLVEFEIINHFRVFVEESI